MSSIYRASLEHWLSNLEIKNAELVIDVGGSQLPVKKRLKSFEAEKYLIADLEQPQVKTAEIDLVIDLNQHFNQQRGVLDYKNMADVVFCLEVFEYIYDPVNAMEVLKSLLKQNGILYLSAPFYYPIHEPIQDDFLRYTENGLKKIAEKVGMKHKKTYYRLSRQNGLSNVIAQEALKASRNIENHNILGYIMELER